jgi:hypothetical protein
MQGKAQHAANVTKQFQEKTDNLHASYEQDAQRLYSLAQSGTDPNSDEYTTAVSAVNGSWGALQDWRDKVVNGPDGGKPKKSNKKQADQPPPSPQQQQQQLMQDLQSPDPKVKAAAGLALQKKLGPPVLWQVKQFYTPEAQAARTARTQGAQNEVTAAGQQGQQLTHQQAQLDAQQKIDDLNKTPQSQWTSAMWEQYNQAQQQIEPRKPGDEAKVAADAIIRKSEADPKYQFTDQDKEVLRGAGYKIDPHLKTQVTRTGEIIQFPEDGGPPEILRPSQATYEPRGRSGGAGSGADKNYKKWDDYYKEHSPNLSDDERDALVRRKVEGANQEQSGSIAHDAIAEPKQFDNDVLSAAIDRLRNLPQYKDMKTLDDALANIVGQGDNGYQYHSKSDLGKPGADGKYSGGVDEAGLKNLERDLQTQIRAVMSGSKETALSPQARRAAMSRMQPLFGPAAAPAGSTKTPESPQAGATPAAPASSPGQAGGDQPKPRKVYQHGQFHGTVTLTDAEAKQLADDPEFKAQGGSIK